MALKGKKKSRVRGSQARRRPAAAPRPSYGTHEKPRWYQTTQGLVIAFLVTAALIIFVWWFVADSRSESQAREATRDQLQTFSSDLRALFQNLAPIASELEGAGTLKPEELPERTKELKNQLGEVQTTVSQVAPPAELTAATGLLSQAMLLYGQSIEQFELVPDLEGATRDEVSAKATASFQAANNIFVAVIELLDKERSEVDLAPSGLTSPGSRATISEPEPGGG